MSYSIYDNDRTVESLTKEFNRTQKGIIKALRTDNQKEYQKLISYRNDIRRVIRNKEQNNNDEISKRNYRTISDISDSADSKCDRPKQKVE